MKLSAEDIKFWLYNHGFEQGLKDKGLHKPLIVLVCVVLGSYVWMSLSASSIERMSEQIIEEQNRAKMIEDYTVVLNIWNSIGKDMMAPKEEDARVWIQKEMAALANEAQVEVVALEPSASQTIGALIYEESRLTIAGNYHNIGRFMAKVENHKPFIGISTFHFMRGDNFDPNYGRVLSATLSIFVFSETGQRRM